MSSSIKKVAKTAAQKQAMPKCACKGSSVLGKGTPDWLNRMPGDARKAMMAGLALQHPTLDVSKHADAKQLVAEVTACLVCGDDKLSRRGLCSACYRQCNRMVLMSETTWVELSLAGCCISDLNDKNHMRRSMITERIVEYRRGRN